MTPDLDDLWRSVQRSLAASVPPPQYDIWLAPLRAHSVDGDRLLVAAPHELRPWVERRFGELLRRCATDASGADLRVELVVEGAQASATAVAGEAAPIAPVRELNPKLTFDQFVIGDGNRLAHAAALAVAEMPGQAYNPLFVYGPPGVGKSHLLHSIANYVQAYGTGLTVRLSSAERFTNDFLAALRTGEVDRFKHAYRHNDVLLIDDVQFLESKARTEEEFFHTFNALYDTGAQVVLTSDRLPRDLQAVADRLRERFEAGLVCDIGPPDRDTRLTILRKRALHDGIELGDPTILEAIADRITDNVRILEGALIRVVAYASLTDRDVTPALAAEVLDRLHPTARPSPGRSAHPAAPTDVEIIARIQDLVCARLEVERGELIGTVRAPRVVWARQVAMHLARECTDASLPAIARAFGGRNHTTVMYALRRAAERLERDPEARDVVRGLTDELGSHA